MKKNQFRQYKLLIPLLPVLLIFSLINVCRMAQPAQAAAPAHDSSGYEQGCAAEVENNKPAPAPQPFNQTADCCLGQGRAANGIIANGDHLPLPDCFISALTRSADQPQINVNYYSLIPDSSPPALAAIASVILKE